MKPMKDQAIRMLDSPLKAEALRPLGAKVEVVQFCSRLTDQEHQQTARLLQKRPDVTLRAFGRPAGVVNVDFLRHYPFVKHVAIDLYNLNSLEGVSHLPDALQSFSLGQTKTKRISLSFLERFQKLEELSLEGHSKDIEVVSRLKALRQLHFRSITLPDLSLLKPLKHLRAFTLKLGGTTALDAIAFLKELRYFEAWMVKGLGDLSVLAKLKSLTHLYLQALAQVTALPSFRPLRSLRWVTIETLKNLPDLTPVAEAPKLAELSLIDMRQLPTSALKPFVGHKSLRAANIGLGSLRRNEEALALLGVSGEVTDKFAAYEEAVAGTA